MGTFKSADSLQESAALQIHLEGRLCKEEIQINYIKDFTGLREQVKGFLEGPQGKSLRLQAISSAEPCSLELIATMQLIIFYLVL